MRVALLHPSYWPEVRRGSERLLHDLAGSLAVRGHEVTVLTTHPESRSGEEENGFYVVRNRRLPDRILARLGYEDFLGAAPQAARELLRGRYDVAHALFQVEGWTAARLRRLGGPPYVLSINGILTRGYLVQRRHRLEMLLRAIAGASATTVLSEAAAARFRQYLGRAPQVVPGGVVTSDFDVWVPRAAVPTIVCAAALDDPRKRGDLLFDAFTRLRARRPAARLLLAGRTDRPDEELPPGVERVAGDRTPELARAYAAAWASVLPSVEEAFGLTLVESLAAGTPAVAARSGGCPEVLTPETGRLFEPDDEVDLARAMEEAIELSARPEAPEACRDRARLFDWSAVVLHYERLYELAARRR